MSGKQAIFTTEENLSHARGTEWRANAAGTNAGATVTKAAETAISHKICWATFYTDVDSIITISDGATVIWEGKIDISVIGFMVHVVFPIPLIGTAGNSVAAEIDLSTSDCRVTIGGFSEKAL